MDPNRALDILCDESESADVRCEAASAILEWIMKGGSIPAMSPKQFAIVTGLAKSHLRHLVHKQRDFD